MKKLFKFIFGLIGAIILLVIITVVVIGIAIYDKTDNSNQEITNQQFDTTELLYAYIENSLEETNNKTPSSSEIPNSSNNHNRMQLNPSLKKEGIYNEGHA